MKSNVLSFLFGSQKNVKAPAVGEAASHSAADIVWPEGGWSPAGYLSTGEYSVFSRKTGRLVYFRPKQLDEANFRAHMGNGYCNANHIVEDPKSNKAVFKA